MADELEPIPDPEEEEGGPVKSFLEHLEDLRWVLIRIFVSVLVGMTICLVAAPYVIDLLKYPLFQSGIETKLLILGPIDAISISMKVAFWGGMCLALPFILFFIGQFIMPALKRHEKPYFRKAFIIGGGLFFVGALLCWGFIAPIALNGIKEFGNWLGFTTEAWRAQDYIQFVVVFTVGMGLSFELPVLILTLVKMGLISHELMAKSRMYFFVINLVLCAFITPDAYSTLFMVIPVQVLFEICLLISGSWERKKRIEEARQRKLEEEEERVARERGERGQLGA